ncbi:MAG: 3-oxoacyl-ACP reductase FabG [Proteobacteria bacterium]|nr:3-oxoacyl-ACP reductase FabG [Pseudomonadota bacterium]
MLTSIAGRVVLVTGASKGIGKGIARVFARHGARVMVVSRHLAEAEACAAELGQGARACAADVSDWTSCQAMAQATLDAFGAIDVLCANAGMFPQTKIEHMDVAEWDAVMATNLKGSFLAVKACLPHLKKSDQARVVLTSSITGPITGFPGWTHYGASKAGQLGFMRTACIELANFGITINAVLPGNIVTEGLADLGEDYLKTMAASIPLKRLGSVDDVGNAALFLASKEAAYITGQTIVVDGGQVQPESLEALNA